jgi:hypothetical protein
MVEGVVPGAPPTEVLQKRHTTPSDLLWQALGAVCWGVFVSVVFFDLLMIGAVLWVPCFVWREYRRSKKHGFLAGFALRLAVIAAVVTGAIYLPVKYEDRIVVGGLATNRVILRALEEPLRERLIHYRYPEEQGGLEVTLPSARPTIRQLVRSIEAQTALRCDIGRCGNGMSFLGGGYIMSFQIKKAD